MLCCAVPSRAMLCRAVVLQKLRWKQLLALPALFSESFGLISQGMTEGLEKRVVMPVMDSEVMNLFLQSSGQHQPPPELPAEFASARPMETAAPIIVEGMPEQPADVVEEAWLSLFKENHLWKDQRKTVRHVGPDSSYPSDCFLQYTARLAVTGHGGLWWHLRSLVS